MALHRCEDRPRGREVDAERLLREQRLAGLDRVDVHLLVQVVAYGDVEHLGPIGAEQVAVVGAADPDRGDAVEPVQGGRVDVAHVGELGPHRMVGQRGPPRRTRRRPPCP